MENLVAPAPKVAVTKLQRRKVLFPGQNVYIS